MTSRHIFCSLTGSWDQLFTQINRRSFLPRNSISSSFYEWQSQTAGEWASLAGRWAGCTCGTAPSAACCSPHASCACWPWACWTTRPELGKVLIFESVNALTLKCSHVNALPQPLLLTLYSIVTFTFSILLMLYQSCFFTKETEYTLLKLLFLKVNRVRFIKVTFLQYWSNFLES